MKRSMHFVRICLVLWVALLSYPSIAADDNSKIRETISASLGLDDGVYPVVTDETRLSGLEVKFGTIKLCVLSVNEEGIGSPKIRIVKRPLLRFDRSIRFGFKMENNECTQVEFDNTDDLKVFSQKYAPTRFAVVVGNRVVTHHKLRGPIESEKIRITCCTEGGGDHLRKHLMRIEHSSASKGKSTVHQRHSKPESASSNP